MQQIRLSVWIIRGDRVQWRRQELQFGGCITPESRNESGSRSRSPGRELGAKPHTEKEAVEAGPVSKWMQGSYLTAHQHKKGYLVSFKVYTIDENEDNKKVKSMNLRSKRDHQKLSSFGEGLGGIF